MHGPPHDPLMTREVEGLRAQGGGAVAVFSLKNPGHPEYFFVAESGACWLFTCLWHVVWFV